jgi:hypothetical protein
LHLNEAFVYSGAARLLGYFYLKKHPRVAAIAIKLSDVFKVICSSSFHQEHSLTTLS